MWKSAEGKEKKRKQNWWANLVGHQHPSAYHDHPEIGNEPKDIKQTADLSAINFTIKFVKQAKGKSCYFKLQLFYPSDKWLCATNTNNLVQQIPIFLDNQWEPLLKDEESLINFFFFFLPLKGFIHVIEKYLQSQSVRQT